MNSFFMWARRCNTRGLQIFLLVLIVIGCILLATQSLWVPKLVDYIISHEQA